MSYPAERQYEIALKRHDEQLVELRGKLEAEQRKSARLEKQLKKAQRDAATHKEVCAQLQRRVELLMKKL